MTISHRRALLPLAAALLASLALAAGADAAPMAAGDYTGQLTDGSVGTGGLLPEIAFPVAATAPFTVPPASGPVTWSLGDVSLPVDLAVTSGLPAGVTGTLSPTLDGPVSASLDPRTGAATATVSGHIDMTVSYLGLTTTCHLASAVSPLTISLSTAKSGGSPYAEGTGAIKLADDAIAIPAAVCDNGTLAGMLNTAAGLPSSNGRASLTGVLTLVRPYRPPADTTPQVDTPTTTTTSSTAAPALVVSQPAVKPPAAARCIVPRLKDRTLNAARKALKKAHCRLGKVTKRKSPRHAGRVLGQARKSGAKLPAGTKVAVKVGRS
jgi:hypothetical protein